VLLAASLAYLVTAAVVPYASPNTVSVAWLVHLAAFAGSLLVSLLLIFWYVKRL
jgi:membrane associated rhomboid family serine protease